MNYAILVALVVGFSGGMWLGSKLGVWYVKDKLSQLLKDGDYVICPEEHYDPPV